MNLRKDHYRDFWCVTATADGPSHHVFFVNRLFSILEVGRIAVKWRWHLHWCSCAVPVGVWRIFGPHKTFGPHKALVPVREGQCTSIGVLALSPYGLEVLWSPQGLLVPTRTFGPHKALVPVRVGQCTSIGVLALSPYRWRFFGPHKDFWSP